MPSKSKKQQRFFFAVKSAKHNPNAPAHLRKVADSMSEKDIDDFTKGISEFKTKKAILSVLKEIQSPIPLREGDEGENSIEAVADQWPEQKDWAVYIRSYVGQPLSDMELNALDTFKKQGGKPPTTLARTEIWYKGVDKMGKSTTSVIKKMKDSNQFSYLACQLQDKQKDPTSSQSQGMNAGDESNNELPSLEEADGMAPDPSNNDESDPTSGETSYQQKEKEIESEKENIIVTKSILFKDDIKGAAILIEFLKKLNL